jgi:6-phospho-beta-glucosidase
LAAALAAMTARTRPIDLILVGRSANKLELVTGISNIVARKAPLLNISFSTDIEKALHGAEIVLNQIRVGGLEARVFDEQFPMDLGLPGEETVGPGGFANATRTIPVAIEYAKLAAKISPQAVFLTFANPSSMVQYAIARYTGVNVIGLCDGPITLCENIAASVGLPVNDLVIDYIGMHHYGWVVGVWGNNQDLLPKALENASIAAPYVDPQLTRALGVIPGLYHNYFFHPDLVLAKKLGKPTRAEELLALQDELMAEYRTALITGHAPESLTKRNARWYKTIVAPLIVNIAEGLSGQMILNVVNRGAVSWLPDGAIIETTCQIDKYRINPLAPPQVPSSVRVWIQKNCAYEMEAIQAIVEHDRNRALRALLLNPLIRTYEQASKTLDIVWKD